MLLGNIKRWTSAAVCLVICLVSVKAASAATLQKAVRELALEVSQMMKGNGESEITMGSFDGPVSPQIIKKTLKEELEKIRVGKRPDGTARMIKVDPDAFWRVSGDVVKEASESGVVIRLETQIKDENGKVWGTWERVITTTEDIVRIAAPPQLQTAPTPRGRVNPAAQYAALRKAVIKPTFAAQPGQTTIRPAAGSPYQVEILQKSAGGEYEPRTLTSKRGKAKVDLRENDVYAIRVYNHSGAPVGVQVLVDGINIFAFSKQYGPGSPFAQRFGADVKFVLAQPQTTVTGWHKFNGPGGSQEFLITEWGASAQAVTGNRDDTNLGTITVMFYSAWFEGQEPPADEPAASRSGASGTGIGERTDNHFRERPTYFGKFLGSVSVRYLRPDIPLNAALLVNAPAR